MRTVAILGRPNVGKSTLFNRLVGRRQALVHDLPGVTRDRLEGEADWLGLQFRVIDTAGLETGTSATLPGRLRAMTLAGLEEADVGLFLIDAREGVTATDLEVAELLRRARKPVILVANKCESRASLAGLGEAWSLGFGEPIGISAEHAEGLSDLFDALKPHVEEPEEPEEPGTVPEPEEQPELGEADGPWMPKGPLRLAIVGRPNVGKSSLVNALTRSERCLTGPEPGLTRDNVRVAWSYADREIELVDTAGLRKRAKIDEALEKLSASATIRAIRNCHAAVLVLDATRPLEHQDTTIADVLIAEGRAVVLALNKWDLVTDPKAVMDDLNRRIEHRLADIPGAILVKVSALTGRNVDDILKAVVEATTRWSSRISTGRLNRWLPAALEAHPPPLVQKRRVKIRFMTQVATRPPTFALFANKTAEQMPDSYLRYMARGLRDTFGLAGVPLRFVVRHGDNPYDPNKGWKD